MLWVWNALKQGAAIPDAPNDLIIVSKMQREWMFQGKRTAKFPTFTFTALQCAFYENSQILEHNTSGTG